MKRILNGLVVAAVAFALGACGDKEAPTAKPEPAAPVAEEYHYVVDQAYWYYGLKIEVLDVTVREDQVTLFVYVENTAGVPIEIDNDVGYVVVDNVPMEVDLLVSTIAGEIPPGLKDAGTISFVDLDGGRVPHFGAAEQVHIWLGEVIHPYKEEPMDLGFNFRLGGDGGGA